MKKRLTDSLTLFFDPLFPKCFANPSRHRALIGVGGNIGNVKRRFKKVALLLRSHPKVRLIATAPLLKNPPFGYTDQPFFYNTLFLVDTDLPPKALLHFLLRLERRFKRVRTFKNAPRTLDLDIIFYDDVKLNSSELTIPHPHWHQRESVIIPLTFLGEMRRCGL